MIQPNDLKEQVRGVTVLSEWMSEVEEINDSSSAVSF